MLRVHQAEQAVRAQHELLHVTLSSIDDGVIATDGEGIVTFINPAACSLLEKTETEVVARPLRAVFHPLSEEGGATECLVEKVLRSRGRAEPARQTLLVRSTGRRFIHFTPRSSTPRSS